MEEYRINFMNESYFRQLLDSYVTGQMTAPDRQDFFRLLEQENYRVLLEKIMQEEWEQGAYEETANEQVGALVETYVMNRIITPASVHRLSFFRRFRVAAAAAILILLTAGYFLFFNKSNKQKELAEINNTKQADDVNPGKYKARLMLSDGSAIVLDSAAQGELVKQGNTQVLNKNGQLVYQASSKASPEGGGLVGAFNTLSTARGEIYSTVLSDGSKVWLNSASSVKFPVTFSGDQRVIEITGEAYLEVASLYAKGGQGKIPFIVKTNGQEITVLGTHFNVNAYTDEKIIRTTLLEGSVRVSNGRNSVLIRPGEQSSLENEFTVKEVNVQDVVAWKNGFFSYRHTDIKGIMRQLSRWYDVDVVYEGTNPEQTFTGKIDRALTLSQVLKILEQTKVHFRIDGKRLIILP